VGDVLVAERDFVVANVVLSFFEFQKRFKTGVFFCSVENVFGFGFKFYRHVVCCSRYFVYHFTNSMFAASILDLHGWRLVRAADF